MSNRQEDDEEEDYGAIKPYWKYGNRNFSDIPCFRRSLLTGILSGFGLGLTHFMFTSNTLKSTKIWLFSGLGVTMSYWFYCRHSEAQAKFLYQRLRLEFQKAYEERGTLEQVEKPDDSNEK